MKPALRFSTVLERRYRESTSDWVRRDVEQYMSVRTCGDCGGRRLRPEVLGVTIGDKNIMAITELCIKECLEFFSNLILTEREALIGAQVLKEIRERLGFLVNVGLDYLALNRAAGTLSGGEAQRIRLATQIGSSLTGVLYILDEPSIGLHQRDNRKLLDTLEELRDLGNTLIVVEHDQETIETADWIIDMGPGREPTEAKWWPRAVWNRFVQWRNLSRASILRVKKMIHVPPRQRRLPNNNWLRIRGGARENNLKNIDVEIPPRCVCSRHGRFGGVRQEYFGQRNTL